MPLTAILYVAAKEQVDVISCQLNSLALACNWLILRWGSFHGIWGWSQMSNILYCHKDNGYNCMYFIQERDGVCVHLELTWWMFWTNSLVPRPWMCTCKKVAFMSGVWDVLGSGNETKQLLQPKQLWQCSISAYRAHLASFPGLHAQLFSLAVQKGGGGRPGRIYHVMRAATDVTY